MMNKRDLVLSLLDPNAQPEMTPAAFFLHFDPAFHTGQAAIDRHLEYFRYTNMDLLKIQFELPFPPQPQIQKPEDWSKLPFFKLDHYEPMLKVVEGVVKAAKKDAIVILTYYSSFMLCSDMVGLENVVRHVKQDAEAFKVGLTRMTESLMQFIRASIALGVDGFYLSTQGGEKDRLEDPALFNAVVRPHDLVIMDEIVQQCHFNILHVCSHQSPYLDITNYAGYPGNMISTSLELANGKRMTARQVSSLFKRPFIGGLSRRGVIYTGTPDQIEYEVRTFLQDAPERTMLGAHCTVPTDTPWDNLRLAIQAAHQFHR